MSFSGTKGYQTKPKPGVMLNPLHPLSRGLVGHWLFNEGSGSRAYDISGKGNHGTLKNIPPNTQGSGWGGSKFGGGIHINGGNDYVNCGHNNSLDITNEFMITARVYPIDSGGGGFGRILEKKDVANSAYMLYCAGTGVQEIKCRIMVGGSSFDAVSTGNALAYNQYHFVAGGFDGSNVFVNVDGIKYIGDATAGPISSVPLADMFIGNRFDTIRAFNGIIDYVNIYERVPSTLETKLLHKDPFCNLLQVPIRRYSVAAPVGAIMNQFQRASIGADLYNGVFA